jgi:hypothetical protein
LEKGYTLLRLKGTRSDTAALEGALRSIGAAPFAVLDIHDERGRDIYGYDLLLLRPNLHVVWRGNRPPDNLVELAAIATGDHANRGRSWNE